MPHIAQGRVRFGSFELDPRAGELCGNGEQTVLQEQPLKVLLMLIEREGEIATRDEIKKKLWPNDTIVEFDSGINATIRKLRRCLGDSAENPQYIQTVAHRGYRLMVPVEWVWAEDSSGEESSAESSSDASESGSAGESDSEDVPKAKLKVGRLTGEVVSHYRVLEVIGGGGMGLVYRAEDLKLGRAVALKFLPEEVGDDPKAHERFEREAHAVSALDHPNICTVYDFDEYQGHPFIAMQLLQGKTLRDYIAEGRFRLTQPEGLEIAIQIASGLEAAHEKGIIHRDIKPANIFITEKNVAKVLDFGVAKVMAIDAHESHSTKDGLSGAPAVEAPGFSPADGEDVLKGRGFSRAAAAPLKDGRGDQSRAGLIPAQSSDESPDGTPKGVPFQSPELKPGEEDDAQRWSEPQLYQSKETTLTRTGMKLGTAGYMSPEQVRGEGLDARSDIFSFGLVLYEMATGERAFTGETEAIVHGAIQNCAPKPACELAAEISPRLNGVITKCLEKEREQRYQAVCEVVTELRELEKTSLPAASNKETAKRLHSGSKRFLAFGVTIALVGLVSTALYRRAHPSPKLTSKDTIVLADFENKTSDPTFTGTFKLALGVAFGQTPFFNLLSPAKVAQVLKLMGKLTDESLTPNTIREVCVRTNSTAYIAGSISDAGNHFHIELATIDCKTGNVLANVTRTANDKGQIVATLGEASYVLRSRLGEPLFSLQRYNKPLAEATTDSIEALQTFAGASIHPQGPDTVAEYLRATELDPEFALAYDQLSIQYYRLREFNLASRSVTKAYDLRERRLSRRDRFDVELHYYQYKTLEFENAISTAKHAIDEFPRSPDLWNILGFSLNQIGDYAHAASVLRDSTPLMPGWDWPAYGNLAVSYIALDRLQEAAVILNEVRSRHFEAWQLHAYRYAIAFLLNDQEGLNAELRWATQNPRFADFLLKEQSETEAFYGRLHKADELMEQAVQSAQKAGARERATTWRAIQTLRRARVGEAGRLAANAENELSVFNVQSMQIAALTLASAGDLRRAEELAQQLGRKYPSGTLVQNCDVPSIRAAIYLRNGNPEAAVKELERARPYDLHYVPQFGLDTAYLRGLAYLQAGKAQEGAAEFQKLIDHPGVVRSSINGPLARLQLARAQVMMGDKDAARKSYQDFLTLWKDADPDIPIYQQAKAEYKKLQATSN